MTYQIPTCENQFVEGTIDQHGNSLRDPVGGLFCLPKDIDALHPNPVFFAKLEDIVPEDGILSTVKVSGYSINSIPTAEAICRLRGIENATVQVFVQRDSLSLSHSIQDVFLKIGRCSRELEVNILGCFPFTPDKITVNAACNRSGFSEIFGFRQPAAYHIKAFSLDYILPKSFERHSIATFGSGNFNESSLSINIEDWVTITDTGNALSEPWWSCIFEQSRDLASLAYDAARENYRQCRARTRKGPNSIPEGIEYFVTPFDSRNYWTIIERAMSEATDVTIVAQFFESKRLLGLIQRQKDTNFTIILDDAYYVSANSNESYNFISPSSAREMLALADNLENVSIEYLQTNHFFEATGTTNTVHARSIYMETPAGPVSLLGSAHFRDGAVNGNSELQIIFRGELANDHREFFDELLSRATDSNHAAFTSE